MVKDSLSELYPIEFILTCKKCELIANTIREQSLEPRTSDLYWIFNGKMSHRTVDKHVKELVTQGYLRRFVGNYSGEISFCFWAVVFPYRKNNTSILLTNFPMGDRNLSIVSPIPRNEI